MDYSKIVKLLALMMSCATIGAKAQCAVQSKYVDQYLREDPNWSIVQVEDLPNDDKILWRSYHAGLCPGISELRLYNDGQKSYGLGLLHRENGILMEKLVIIRGVENHLVIKTLIRPYAITTPSVVWRAKPGKYVDRDTGKEVDIRNDSLIYEKMEAKSVQFYSLDDRIYSLLAAE